jgi:hypothetical protein
MFDEQWILALPVRARKGTIVAEKPSHSSKKHTRGPFPDCLPS